MKVKCDHCKKESNLDINYLCPSNWFYTELDVNGTSDTMIIYACSKECSINMWKQGPGPMLTQAERFKLTTDYENIQKAKEIIAMIEVTSS